MSSWWRSTPLVFDEFSWCQSFFFVLFHWQIDLYHETNDEPVKNRIVISAMLFSRQICSLEINEKKKHKENSVNFSNREREKRMKEKTDTHMTKEKYWWLTRCQRGNSSHSFSCLHWQKHRRRRRRLLFFFIFTCRKRRKRRRKGEREKNQEENKQELQKHRYEREKQRKKKKTKKKKRTWWSSDKSNVEDVFAPSSLSLSPSLSFEGEKKKKTTENYLSLTKFLTLEQNKITFVQNNFLIDVDHVDLLDIHLYV